MNHHPVYQIYSTSFLYSKACPKCYERFGDGDGRRGIDIEVCFKCSGKRAQISQIRAEKDRLRHLKRIMLVEK